MRLADGRVRLAHVDHLLADGSARPLADGSARPLVADARSPDAPSAVPLPGEPGRLRGPLPDQLLDRVRRRSCDTNLDVQDSDESRCVSERVESRSFDRGVERQKVRRSERLAEKCSKGGGVL